MKTLFLRAVGSRCDSLAARPPPAATATDGAIVQTEAPTKVAADEASTSLLDCEVCTARLSEERHQPLLAPSNIIGSTCREMTVALMAALLLGLAWRLTARLTAH